MRRWLVLVFVLTFSVVATAEESQLPDNTILDEYLSEEGVLALGLGVLVSESPYDGVDTSIIPIPLVYYKKGNLTLQTNQLRYNLYNDSGLSVGPIVKLRGESLDPDDSSAVEGMSDRDFTVDGGVAATYFNPDMGVFSGSFQTDLTGKHKGQEFRLQYMLPFLDAFGNTNLIIAPLAGASWRTTLLNDYYYSVRPGQATAGRPSYKSGGAANIFAGVLAFYRLNERWSCAGTVQIEWLGDEITDSPVVDRHHRLTAIVWMGYRF